MAVRATGRLPRRAGKGLRAALCLAACSAHGGLEDDALAAAAAIELAHSAFLVHDDIQDGSDWRRGQPTLHRRVGVPLALNAGDALAVLSLEVLRAGTGGSAGGSACGPRRVLLGDVADAEAKRWSSAGAGTA